MNDDHAAKVRRRWDSLADRYDRAMRWGDRIGFGEGRRWVAARAVDEVLEVAIGTGLNLPFYPPGVRLTGLDLSPAMLAIAADRAAAIGREIVLLEGDAQALPFADGSFDTVVCTLGLCEMPDEQAAIHEIRRVLRPGGRLLLLDHVVSSWWPIRIAQRMLEPVSVRTSGEHLTRRPLPVVAAAGFAVTDSRRWRAGVVERLAAVKSSDG